MNTETIRFDVPLEKLNWKLKTYHFCKYAGYNYLSDFIGKSVTKDIMTIRNLGQINVDEIINSLLEYAYMINDDIICPPIKVTPECKIYEFNYKSSTPLDKLKGKTIINNAFVIALNEENAFKMLHEKHKIKNAIITRIHEIKEGTIFGW